MGGKDMAWGIKFSGSRRGPLSPRPILKYIYDQHKKLWLESLGVFLDVLASTVHVDTGMSKASLVPLSKEIDKRFRRKSIFLASIAGNGPKTGAYRHLGGTNWEYDPNLAKSISTGIEQGKKAYKLDFGSPSTPKFKFEFYIVVFQYYLHDAWGGIELGREAFLNHWNANAFKFVKPGVISRFWATGRIIDG